MKKTVILGTALFLVAPLAALASCESVKADIAQKIIANGVPESGFTLDIVPNDQVNQAGGLVVGHCENDSHKIVYTRHAEGDANTGNASAPAEGQPTTTP
ncbi:DUF1161 domain-containing protein [Pectobacterium aroidearum]|uniref:DUF1161 domain-containing protein n=1 Tax=Pectobacterium aroidearum TaxID=1201031 RepID=A0ABR5Z918_9GAMM|nr:MULTISPECIES: DUF1161 domain-containing protein [Pectobacterium]MBA5198261.1 DUF1161 domain-containing protein [Pectobacterium aroidearum]MBA5227235.1 DUF1161 domain-containing protein [Pectobacterium aroidearum]MBA5231054.1 DUF1161 domain-containing protein [Pectobacterium aroidearum]MBA5600574.1 DUF1161 domain-containing protein [Pectobacterium aroidearum]MBA5736200.1 DUF1161 domain-containing protein [Pectobacterium aroidearum]